MKFAESKKFFLVSLFIIKNYCRLFFSPRKARFFFTEVYLMATVPGGEGRHQLEDSQRRQRFAQEEEERLQRRQQEAKRLELEEEQRKKRYQEEIQMRLSRLQ